MSYTRRFPSRWLDPQVFHNLKHMLQCVLLILLINASPEAHDSIRMFKDVLYGKSLFELYGKYELSIQSVAKT